MLSEGSNKTIQKNRMRGHYWKYQMVFTNDTAVPIQEKENKVKKCIRPQVQVAGIQIQLLTRI
jgi:hypothetical protein